jgi:hypothetical protein
MRCLMPEIPKRVDRMELEEDWSIMRAYGDWRVLHYCARGVYSWDIGITDKAWTLVGREEFATDPVCMACSAEPPDTVLSVVTLLRMT